jgi:hypothetical protein
VVGLENEVIEVEQEAAPAVVQKHRSRAEPGSMEDILTDCSPGKEEGIVPLRSSPDREPSAGVIADDGFDLDMLATIREDSETESPRFDLSALLSKRIILPSHLECSALFQQPGEVASDLTMVRARPPAAMGEAQTGFDLPPARRPNHVGGGFKRPQFRRALSMLDPPACSDNNSPLSRGGGGLRDYNIPRFKRPNPPGEGPQQSLSKRRKCSPLAERSTSMEEGGDGEGGGEADSSCSSGGGGSCTRPKFHRSHSETELSIMKSCQLKEEVENILPDSSRYLLANN